MRKTSPKAATTRPIPVDGPYPLAAQALTVVDRRGRGASIHLANELIDVYGRQLGPEGLAVYVALAGWVQRGETGMPALARLAQQTGMSLRQVRQTLAKLKQLGLLSLDTAALPPGRIELRLLKTP